MAHLPHAFARLHKFALPLALVIFAGMATLAYSAVTVLGAGPPQKPSCPDANDSCIVEARVSGFQIRMGKTRKPFVAKAPGRIVAWSIKLGKPSGKDVNCLSNGCKGFQGFGGPARAKIGVLKPIRDKIKAGKPVYQLLRQSPVEELAPYFGTTITFTLQRPLAIKKGHIVVLTIPTWAPMFVSGLPSSYSWRASRAPTKKRGGCTITKNGSEFANVRAGSPHQAVGKERRYACVYKTNRLLYSATVVPRPRGGK